MKLTPSHLLRVRKTRLNTLFKIVKINMLQKIAVKYNNQAEHWAACSFKLHYSSISSTFQHNKYAAQVSLKHSQKSIILQSVLHNSCQNMSFSKQLYNNTVYGCIWKEMEEEIFENEYKCFLSAKRVGYKQRNIF